MRYILSITFILLATLSCNSMDAETGKQQANPYAFDLMRLKLEEKLSDFKDYIDDSIDYWSSLKKKFDPDVPYNHKNIEKHLEELNTFDREACKGALNALQTDPEFRNLPVLFLRYATMNTIMEHFETKINNRKNTLKSFELNLSALKTEAADQVFLSLLSQYILYFDSRSRAIISDSSPVFSAFAGQYEEYDGERIRGEITKNDMVIRFFRSIYPFVKENKEIQKFLSYCPMLSQSLHDPSSIIDLDAFCLDAIIIKSHGGLSGGIDVQENSSKAQQDIQFMERTLLPLIDRSILKTIADGSFAKEKSLWDSLYQRKTKEFAPKIKLTLEETKFLKATTLPPQQGEMLKRNKKKGKNKGNKQQGKIAIASSSATAFPQKKIETEERKEENTSAKENLKDDKKEVAVSHPLLVPTPATTPYKQTQLVASPALGVNKDASKITRAQKKAEKKLNKALSHNLVASSSQPSAEEESIHRMLSNTDVIHLNITHYATVCDLLQNNLPPTVRYDNIITALENIGIKVEARGNGDYRKLLLPNGRKIFIYRPAVPQVGERFLKKLRKELLEKWGLTPKNLAVKHERATT